MRRYMLPAFAHAAADGLRACAPVLGSIMLAALLAPLALGGWSFSTRRWRRSSAG